MQREEIIKRHLDNGVHMMDSATTYIDETVEIAAGVFIYPGCILEGNCKIAKDTVIGPYTHMKDSIIGKGSTIKQSVLVDAQIGENTNVGPFAYLRPGAVVGNNCRIGNFVEIKNSNIGDNVAMAHLAYIGDADVGDNVNYSCGAITANYDGKKKHRTTIKDGAFIGCNSVLIAPVEVGEKGFIAAGSTINEYVPACSLGIARERQTTKENWVNEKEVKK